MKEKAPEPVVAHDNKPVDTKMSKLKLALLYTVVGGLVISALISVVSILIGEFSETAGRALLTTLIFVTHSLLVIALVSADRNNRLGKDIISTTILATVIANMFTSTLGTWELWKDDASWRAFLVYVLLIGASFIVTASLKLRLGTHKATNILALTTTALIVILTLLLIPWLVVSDPTFINAFYYRLIGAVTILAATALSITVIFNRIGAAQHSKTVQAAKTPTLPGGMLAIYISIGTIVALFWITGFFNFITSAATVDRSNKTDNSESYNDKYNDRGEYRYR